MNELILGRPDAIYDPAGTTIRLSYDPEFNLLENPTFSHELTHYGQNILTSLGIDQTLMFHELYYSTCQILLSNIQAKMPFAKHKFEENKPIFWEHGELAILFQKNVIGKPFIDKLGNFVNSLNEMRSKLLKSTFTPGDPNSFYFEYKWRGPGFGIKLNKEEDMFFRMDGHFIQEIHSRSTEFITQWSQEKLSIDDAVTYFHHSLNNPYTLLYLAVSKLITERIGQGVYDVQDSIFLCHLCSQIALTYTGLDTDSFIKRDIRTARIRFSYIDPGELFIQALSAALDQFVAPGWAVVDYFNLMEATITKLQWPKFDQMMNETKNAVNKQLEQYIKATNDDNSEGYNAYIYDKWLSSINAIEWLLERYMQREKMDFIRAPILIVAEGIVRGPLIASPSKLSVIRQVRDTTNNASPTPDMIKGMLIAFVVRKLWFENELSCLEPKDSPLEGSVIGCEDTSLCKSAIETKMYGSICNNSTWLKLFEHIPGLSSKVNNIKFANL